MTALTTLGTHLRKTASFADDAVLLDASTVVLLTGHFNYHALFGDYFASASVGARLVNALRYHAARRTIEGRERHDVHPLVTVLSFLETWLLYDNIVVDRAALESVTTSTTTGRERVDRVVKALFDVVEIPDEVNRKAGTNVAEYADYLRDSDDPIFGRGGALPGDYDLELKDSFFTKVDGHLGISGNVPSRALFYFEVSRLLNRPLVLHPRKSEYLRDLGQSLATRRLEAYSELVTRVRETIAYSESEVPIPPLADEILRLALGKRLSLVDAAKAVKENCEVQSLGRLIRRLSDPSAAVPHLRRSIRETAAKIGKDITNRIAVDGVISSRIINLAKVPAIGWILEVADSGKARVPDIILCEKPYNAIFSRWANSARLTANDSST